VTEVVDGRAVAIAGDPDHPVTGGWLCAKVRPYLNHVYHQDRLTRPLRRVGPKGSGRWAAITWAEALDEVRSRWSDIIRRYGAEAILPYSYSGTLGLVQMTVASGRFWNRLGASQLARSICGEAAAMAVNATLGGRWSPAYDEVAHSQIVIVWGHNPVSTAPHFLPALRAAQRAGTRLVVIDPRRTRTAAGADWHLAPRPGTDGALALGMAHHIVAQGWHDESWLAEHAVGWPALRERLADYSPARVAAICGLKTEEVTRLAALYAQERPALIKIADGINRHTNGGQTARAICALPAITGQYGVAGGGLAYSTSGYVQWSDAAVNYWSDSPPPGRFVNMNRLGQALQGEVSDPPIMSLFVFGANPAAVNPNAAAVIAGLQREDLFTVVHELFMTDTAELADLVLPATSQLEQVDLHKAYGHTVLTYNAPAIPPLGESKSNWDVMRLMAEAMGFDETWLHAPAEAVIDEVLAKTARENPLLAGVTQERLVREGRVVLPVQAPPFAAGVFPTPSGKVELWSGQLAAQGLDPLPGYVPATDEDALEEALFDRDEAFVLITAAAHHFVTSSLANQDALRAREGVPYVEIHPEDAVRRGVADGDQVIVENRRGWCQLKARVTDGVRPGVLASPKGHWLKHHGGRNVNFTTPDALGDFAGQSTFHTNWVWLRRVGVPAARQ
jgi:anaerobic selenocysteine-containing dehydrogenase